MVREELVESVMEVKRVSDRLMAIKLGVKRSILNIVSAYAPQVNNSMKEKNYFLERPNQKEKGRESKFKDKMVETEGDKLSRSV